MRAKRSKQYRKLMHQYGVHFGFREPYQVLVDAEILQDASRFKMDFSTGLRKVLHGDVKMMITQCCIRHLYNADPKDENLIEHAKAFERRRCNHHNLDEPMSAFECIASVLDPKDSRTNKHRYIIATQDESLRAYLRSIPGVPLIYVKRSVMIMEPMAVATEHITRREELLKFKAGIKASKSTGGAPQNDEEIVDGGQNNIISGQAMIQGEANPIDIERGPQKKKRKRGPSGPNPLSIKKPKTRSANAELTNFAQKPPKLSLGNASGTLPIQEVAHKKRRKRKHAPGKAKEVMEQAGTSP